MVPGSVWATPVPFIDLSTQETSPPRPPAAPAAPATGLAATLSAPPPPLALTGTSDSEWRRARGRRAPRTKPARQRRPGTAAATSQDAPQDSVKSSPSWLGSEDKRLQRLVREPEAVTSSFLRESRASDTRSRPSGCAEPQAAASAHPPARNPGPGVPTARQIAAQHFEEFVQRAQAHPRLAALSPGLQVAFADVLAQVPDEPDGSADSPQPDQLPTPEFARRKPRDALRSVEARLPNVDTKLSHVSSRLEDFKARISARRALGQAAQELIRRRHQLLRDTEDIDSVDGTEKRLGRFVGPTGPRGDAIPCPWPKKTTQIDLTSSDADDATSIDGGDRPEDDDDREDGHRRAAAAAAAAKPLGFAGSMFRGKRPREPAPDDSNDALRGDPPVKVLSFETMPWPLWLRRIRVQRLLSPRCSARAARIRPRRGGMMHRPPPLSRASPPVAAPRTSPFMSPSARSPLIVVRCTLSRSARPNPVLLSVTPVNPRKRIPCLRVPPLLPLGIALARRRWGLSGLLQSLRWL